MYASAYKMLTKFLAVAAIGVGVMAPLARADVDFQLTLSSCCGSGPFGDVVLHQVDSKTVQVTETLDAGAVFAVGGAGNSLGFNVDKSFTYVANTLTKGFTSGVDGKASPFPNFSFYVDCTDLTVCGHGTSSPDFSGPLTFEISNAGGLSVSDFTANAGGYYFASDVGWPKSGGGFNTGNVAANSFTTVPEPSSILQLVTLLLAIAVGSYRFRFLLS